MSRADEIREALKISLRAMPKPEPRPLFSPEPAVPPAPRDKALEERMNDPYYPCDAQGRPRYAGD